MKISESNVQRAICEFLAAKRVRFHRLNAGTHVIQGEKGRRVFKGQAKGCADLLALVKGKLALPDPLRMPGMQYYEHGRTMDGVITLYIECKAPGKKQQPEQIDFQREVEEYGCTYLLADSVDVVMDWFKERGL